MADASLDDFFAKKDKRTKKSKGKLTPAELVVKQETELKAPKKKKEKDKNQTQSSSTPGTSAVVEEEEQEWKEFVEETEKDYSGLRIQNLQISKEEEDEESDRRESEEDGEGEEGKEKRDTKDGPWKKGQAVQPENIPQHIPEPEPVPKTEEPRPTGKYVPPSVRYAAIAGVSSNSSQSRKKKGAPNIKSEEDFPTLGGSGGGPIGMRWGDQEMGDRTFEQVRGGNKQMDDPASKNVSLTLGNKFQALKQE